MKQEGPWTKTAPAKGLNSHLAESNLDEKDPSESPAGEHGFNQSDLHLLLRKTRQRLAYLPEAEGRGGDEFGFLSPPLLFAFLIVAK